MCFRELFTTCQCGADAPRRRPRQSKDSIVQAEGRPGFPAGGEMISAPRPPPAASISEAGPASRSSLMKRESRWSLRNKESAPQTAPALSESSIGIGIETEFLLEGRDRRTRDANIVEFARKLAHLHNQEAREKFPLMFSEISFERTSSPGNYSTWALVREPTIETRQEPCKGDLLALFRYRLCPQILLDSTIGALFLCHDSH